METHSSDEERKRKSKIPNYTEPGKRQQPNKIHNEKIERLAENSVQLLLNGKPFATRYLKDI